MVAALLVDARTGLNPRFTLMGQFRQSLYSRLAAYKDTDDAEQWSRDPSNRQGGGQCAEEKKTASTYLTGRGCAGFTATCSGADSTE